LPNVTNYYAGQGDLVLALTYDLDTMSCGGYLINAKINPTLSNNGATPIEPALTYVTDGLQTDATHFKFFSN